MRLSPKDQTAITSAIYQADPSAQVYSNAQQPFAQIALQTGVRLT
jgi:hypothetical protein